MSSNKRFVPDYALSREWDARFNVPTPEDLENILSNVKSEAAQGKYRYALVSGVEIGKNQYQDDYLMKHVHCAFVFQNRVSKNSILKNLSVKRGNGFYLVPRNQDLPYSGWVNHHKKTDTKVNPDSLSLYEFGDLPKDKTEVVTVVKRSEEEKKRKIDDVLRDLYGMIEKGEDDQAFDRFPKAALDYTEKIKARQFQRRDYFQTKGNPHIWLKGLPGTGKSAILQVIYPDYYQKNVDTKFFDRYNPNHHSHVLLQDVDHNVMERLGVAFFKCICDEGGYPVDAKYKSPQIERLTVLITSNFNLDETIPEDLKGRRENLAALRRRYWEIDIRDLLKIVGLKLLPKYEINQLKKAGNLDPRKLFMSWDHIRDCPTGEDVPSAEDLQETIRNAYYK